MDCVRAGEERRMDAWNDRMTEGENGIGKTHLVYVFFFFFFGELAVDNVGIYILYYILSSFNISLNR